MLDASYRGSVAYYTYCNNWLMFNLWGSWLIFLTSAIEYEIFIIIVFNLFFPGCLGRYHYCWVCNGPWPDRHKCTCVFCECPISRVQLLSWVSYNTQHDMPSIIYTCFAIHSFIQESIRVIFRMLLLHTCLKYSRKKGCC